MADLVAKDESNQQFVKRKAAHAVPSSQASTKAGSKLTSLVADTTTNHFPKRDSSAQVMSGSHPTAQEGNKLTNLAPPKQSKRFPQSGESEKKSPQAALEPQAKTDVSLTDLLPQRASKRFPQSGQTTPQPAKKAASSSITQPKPVVEVKRKGLSGILPKGQPVSGDRRSTTRLGNMVNRLQAPTKDERQQAMKKDVLASAAVQEKPGNPVESAYSSLSSIIKTNKPREREPRDGILKERTTQTKLGEMAKSGAAESLPPAAAAQPQTVPVATDNQQGIEKVKAAASKAKCAFQRALLSARIANDAVAKIYKNTAPPSVDGKRKSSLTKILNSEVKPTLSQQKAFANSSRHTSLFPEKKESKLQSLLKK